MYVSAIQQQFSLSLTASYIQQASSFLRQLSKNNLEISNLNNGKLLTKGEAGLAIVKASMKYNPIKPTNLFETSGYFYF
ncbi:hypothetical protein ACFL3D_05980 [Candidatus Omnitrophota bacterium]